MKKSTIIAIGIVAGLSAWGVGIYGNFVSKESNIKESWAEMDELIKQRNSLIPEIINTTKIYANNENRLFDKTDSTLNSINEQNIDFENVCAQEIELYLQYQCELAQSIDNIIALQQTHPQLRECQTFLDLQSSLQESQKQIDEKLKILKINIDKYNSTLNRVPNKFIASWFNFSPIKVECEESSNATQE